MVNRTWFNSILLLIVIVGSATNATAQYSWNNLPKITEPVFKKDTFNIVQYGAKPDGLTLNTKSINDAIAACSKKGGGVVLIPAGLWLTGPVVMQSNVNLHLNYAAILQFSADFDQYPLVEGNWEGKNILRIKIPPGKFAEQNNISIEKLKKIVDLLIKKDLDKIEKLAEELSNLEHEADLTKNDIRNHLPKSLFLPIDHRQFLEILSVQDSIADKAEEIGILLTLRLEALFQDFTIDIPSLFNKNSEVFWAVKKIIEEMDALLESSFGGLEAEKVKKQPNVKSVTFYRRQLHGETFPNDEVTPPVTKMYLVMMIFVNCAGFCTSANCLCTGYKSNKIFRLPATVITIVEKVL